MKQIVRAAILMAGMFGATTAMADDVKPPVRPGALIISSDGYRVGQIDSIVKDDTGAPLSASVILGSRFVHIPVSTLTPGEKKRLVSSMSSAEINHLR